LLTIAIWVVASVAMSLILGLPGYVSCGQSSTSGYAYCGLSLGLTFFIVGLVQLVIGGIAAVIAFRIRPPVAQGILIAISAVLVLSTVVCFGATIKA
jgi:hypothetical protein